MLSHAGARRAVALTRLPVPQTLLPAARATRLAHSHTRAASSMTKNQPPPRPATVPQSTPAAPAAAAAAPSSSAADPAAADPAAADAAEVIEYGAAWQAPRSSAPPPIMLPRWVERLVSWVRGGARSSTQIRAGRLYNLSRAHPLATPSAAELKQLKAQHAEQVALNPRHPPFVSPSVRLRSLGLNDDELTRFRLIGLHLWMLQKALLVSVNGPDAQLAFAGKAPASPEERARAIDLNAAQKRLMSYLFENFWLELTPYLLEVRGEMKLTRTLQEVQEHFYGFFCSLDVAWFDAVGHMQGQTGGATAGAAVSPANPSDVSAAQGTAGVEGLAAVLWRNLYVGDTRVKKRDVYVLTLYMLRQMHHLSTVSHDDLWNLGPALGWRFDGALPRHSDNIEELLTRNLKVAPTQWRNSDYHQWYINNLPDDFTLDFRKKK